MKSSIWILISILLSSSLASAKIKTFNDKISVAAAVVNHDYTLGLDSNLENIDRKVKYEPNTASLSGFEVSYRWLTVAYLTSDGFSEEDIQRKGKTSYEDIRGGLFLGKKQQFVVLGYYNRYKGFYMSNTAEVDPTAALFIQRSDIETFNAGGALMYIWDPDEFSAAAAYVQSAVQVKSGGSLLLMVSFDGNTIDADADLIPTNVESDFGDQRDLDKAKFATLTASIGYSHTFVWKYFFINGTVLFGRGQQTKDYEYGTEKVSETGYTSKFNLGYSLGYNGESFYAGLSFVLNDNEYDVGSVKVSPSLASNRYFIGIRF